MYICKQAETKLINYDSSDEQLTDAKEQWWRISYAPGVNTPVTVEVRLRLVDYGAQVEGRIANWCRKLQKKWSSRLHERAPSQYLSTQVRKQWPLRIKNCRKLSRFVEPEHIVPVMTWANSEMQTFVRFDNRTFQAEFQGSGDSHTAAGDSPMGAEDLPVGTSSPGKRKYGESSLVNQDSNPYAPVNIAARAVHNSMGSGDVTMGVDPANARGESPPAVREMQERSGMPMLSSQVSGSATKLSTLDSMDLDQVVEDDEVADDSAAVKHVGPAV